MNKNKKVWLTLSICLLVFTLTNCTQKTEATQELKITINSWIGWSPLYLAKEKGLLENTNLIITRVEDTGSRKSTMIAGHVDGYASSVDNFALDSAVGVPGRIVLCFDESYGGDGIVSKKSIKSISELKGKKIAFQRGFPSHFLLLSILKKAGLSSEDIRQIDMDADKAGVAFAAGRLDVAVTWEPWLSKAAEMADGQILVTTKDYPGLIVDTLVFRPKVLKEKKQAVQNVINGWFKALDYWKSNKEESDTIMAIAYGLDVNEFRAMCEGVRFYDLATNKEYFGVDKPGPIYAVFSSASEIWLEIGEIDAVTSPEEAIDSSFIRSAEKIQ